MAKPTLYFVIWWNSKNELKQFNTDCEHSALWMETRRRGIVYIDTRYEAKLRLYKYLIHKNLKP